MKRVLALITFALLVFLSAQAQKRPDLLSDKQTYLALPETYRLVPLHDFVPDMHTDIVYATPHNFTHQVLYAAHQVLVVKPLALALQKAAAALRKKGYGLLVYDAYRPYAVTVKMWEIVPDSRYAANPSHGSDHNRGTAIDVSLYDLKTRKPLEMPTAFDNFTEKAHLDYRFLSPVQLHNRKILQKAMSDAGLKPLRTEWWHFSLPNSKNHPLLDIPFSEFPTGKN